MDTIPRLLDHQSQTRGTGLAMRSKKRGLWRHLSWSDMQAQVQKFACGLADLGVGKGDTVAIIGGNSSRIFFAITACQSLGAIPAPVYGNLAGEELRHMLEKLGCRYVVAEDQQQVDAVLDIKSSVIEPKAIIYAVSRGMSLYDSDFLHDFPQVQKRGEQYMLKNPSFYADKVAAGTADDAAMVLFSSGVGGHPKPAVLRHRHILSAARYLARAGQVSHRDEALSFMPIFLPVNLLSGYVLSHLTGMCLSCPESDETVLHNLCETSPSILYAPPHVYKQIYSGIRERMRLTHGLQKRLYDTFMDSSRQHSAIGDILIKAPIREMYGFNRLRLALTGGDAISTEVFSFFKALGVEIRQVYGTAETFGCIAMQTGEVADDHVGTAAGQMEIKINPEGEILSRGDAVFGGYYQDEQLTSEVLDKDGWFRTGDVGSLGSDGRLVVNDRLDSIGKLGAGTVFMPKVIEKEIKESVYVNEVFISGAKDGSLVAIITIESETVGAWADTNNIRYTGYADLATKNEVLGLIGKEVENANLRLSGKQPEVGSFIIFHRQFTPQTGELTWTYKIRRQVMQEKFKDMLQALYSGSGNFEFDDLHSGTRINFQIYNC